MEQLKRRSPIPWILGRGGGFMPRSPSAFGLALPASKKNTSSVWADLVAIVIEFVNSYILAIFSVDV
jgi:hypothetical protein